MMVRRLKYVLSAVAIASAPLVTTASAHAADAWTEWGSVTLISAGWVEDTIAVQHNAAFVNPAKCNSNGVPASPTGGYATNPNDPGHSLFHTVLLSAFMNGRDVQLLIRDCVWSKPRIIGVNVR